MNYDILNKADEVICERIEKDEIKGASLCVIHKGDTVYFRSFGMADVARDIPMTKDSIFRCYSMTKPVTAAAVMTVGRERAYFPERYGGYVSSGVSGSEGVKGRRACAGAAEGDAPASAEYDSRCDISGCQFFRRELICRI